MGGRFPRYAALPFVVRGEHVVAGVPVRCMDERAALACAERLLTVFGSVGSVALRRASHTSDRLEILMAFGDVPRASDFDGPSGSVTIMR